MLFSKRGNSPNLKLASEKPVPVLVYDEVEFLTITTDNSRWDHSNDDNIRVFLTKAQPKNYFESRYRPLDLVKLLEKVRPKIEELIGKMSGGYINFCTNLAMEMLGEWKQGFDKGHKLPLIMLQRPIAIALVLGIREENREIMIGFMRYAGVDPIFGFIAAYELAKLRTSTKEGRLTREELLDWKAYLLHQINDYSRSTLTWTLELIERQLGNGSCC